MPRIRYYKTGNPNYENPPDCSNLPTTDDEQDDEITGDYTTQPKGWWSTSTVIRSLPENKIRQAIANYRAAIRLLEDELVSRSISSTENRHHYRGLVLQETRPITRRNVQLSGTSRRRYVGVLKKLRLSGTQREEILKEWLLLIQQYKNKGATE